MARTSTRNTAKKTTPTKKTTSRAPRQPATPSTKAGLSLVKTPADRATTVDLRKPLTVRRRLFVGPMGPNEQAAIRAALTAASAHLPIPVRTWNGSTAHLTDGTLLIHNPGPDRLFTAHIACRHGAIHGYPITTHTDLREARALTHACERPHSSKDADTAITHGIQPTPTPKGPAILQLREGIHRANASAAETQPLSQNAIAEGLAARTADTETAKEHPQP